MECYSCSLADVGSSTDRYSDLGSNWALAVWLGAFANCYCVSALAATAKRRIIDDPIGAVACICFLREGEGGK